VKKILIVDDSKAMRMLVMRALRQAGHGSAEFKEAANGLEALAAVRADRPDLVLSDWNMPEMNGIELLAKLNEEGLRVPFGFVTSEGTEVMRERARHEGALFLIAKPFTPEAFQDALSRVGK
jgi:two-component system chemotaxis response regulator CheY